MALFLLVANCVFFSLSLSTRNITTFSKKYTWALEADVSVELACSAITCITLIVCICKQGKLSGIP